MRRPKPPGPKPPLQHGRRRAAFPEYAGEVRAGIFPDEDLSYRMKPEEAAKFAEALTERTVMPTAGGARHYQRA